MNYREESGGPCRPLPRMPITTMPNLKNTVCLKKDDIVAFCRKEGIELFILFGSGAEERDHRGSDADVALQLRRGVSTSKLKLIFELEGILDPWTVDLVMLTPETPPLLLHEVFTKGQLVYESAEGLFESGKLRAWHLYLDSAPLRKREKELIDAFVRGREHVS